MRSTKAAGSPKSLKSPKSRRLPKATNDASKVNSNFHQLDESRPARLA